MHLCKVAKSAYEPKDNKCASLEVKSLDVNKCASLDVDKCASLEVDKLPEVEVQTRGKGSFFRKAYR